MCDSCYGEFCKACLVLPKGRRNPICTHCTLALSGVRGHATVEVRGDKRTVKQRRAELQAAATQPADDKVFRFFDADSEASAPAGDGSGRKGGRRGNRRDRRSKSEPDEPGREAKPATAPLPMPAEVAAAAAALKAAATGEGHQRSTGTAKGAAGGEPADPTELVTVTRAVARLEELRRQGTPPASSPVPPVPDSPEAEPAHPDESEPVAAAEAAPEQTKPARKAGPPPKPQPVPGPRSDRRQPEGADREGRPPTAPMVGEVRTIGGRRSSDQAPPPQPARTRPAAAAPPAKPAAKPAAKTSTATQERRGGGDAPGDTGIDDELVDVGPTLSGVAQFDSRQPPPAPAAAGEGRKADTDSRGNWIPPILRGMAPDAREAKTNLPQRKRGS